MDVIQLWTSCKNKKKDFKNHNIYYHIISLWCDYDFWVFLKYVLGKNVRFLQAYPKAYDFYKC